MAKYLTKIPCAYEPTYLPGGLAQLIKSWEILRELNAKGYTVTVNGHLIGVEGYNDKKVDKGTVCSPFTATSLAMALDPDMDTKAAANKIGPYKPLINGEKKEALKYGVFYPIHNTSAGETRDKIFAFLDRAKVPRNVYGSAESIVYFGLGFEVEATQMRRGDHLGIDWSPSGGHSAFCWDVHLNARGEVDCFQLISSNGNLATLKGLGVSVAGMAYPFDKTIKMKGTQESADLGLTAPMFTDVLKAGGGYDHYISHAMWYALPGVKYADIDRKTFRGAKENEVYISAPGKYGPPVGQVVVTRLYYKDPPAPPEPYASDMKGAGLPVEPPPPHAPETQPVTRNDVSGTPDPVGTTPPKPVPQIADEPTPNQIEVERALQELWNVRWIDADPGEPDAVNDPKTQAAIKDVQKKCGLPETGVANKATRDKIFALVASSRKQMEVEQGLKRIAQAGLIDKDPGEPDGVNDDASKASVKAFQEKYGLYADGIPGDKTQAKLKEVVATLPAGGGSAPTVPPPTPPAETAPTGPAPEAPAPAGPAPADPTGGSPTAPANPSAPPDGAAPAQPPQPAITFYWVGNRTSVGGQATLTLRAAELAEEASLAVTLKDDVSGKEAPGPALPVKGGEGSAEFAVPADFGMGAQLQARIESTAPPFQARTTAPLYVGTDCPDCKILEALAADGSVATKVKYGGDGVSISAFQRHIVRFGFNIGKSGAKKDGVDGDYGEASARALRAFAHESKPFKPATDSLAPDYPAIDGEDPFALDAEHAKLVIAKCKEGFKTKGRQRGTGGPAIKSSKITVGGTPFVDWFNQQFRPANNRGTGIVVLGREKFLFPDSIESRANFTTVFDGIATLSGKTETPLEEFIAFFGIFYNETGGSFVSKAEDNGKPWYLFGTDGGKASYNAGVNRSRKAGDQLRDWGKISSPPEISAWNGTVYRRPAANADLPFYPSDSSPAVIEASKECDFYKYQGRGLTQVTWREGFQNYVDPALRDAGYSKNCDAMTTAELDAAMSDPKVYLRVVHNEWHRGQVGAAFPDVLFDPPDFFFVGYHVSGNRAYGRVYERRCQILRKAMIAAGYAAG